jgi:hypothetical protein
MGSQETGIAHGCQKAILPFVLEQGLALPGFVKELRNVAAFHNAHAIRARRLTQSRAAHILKIDQPKISRLLRGFSM